MRQMLKFEISLKFEFDKLNIDKLEKVPSK